MGFFDLIPNAYNTGDRITVGSTPLCGACKLYKKCISPRMKVCGKGKIPILFVGEAPGETEDKLGEPFVGASGAKLRSLCKSIGFDMSDCFITNAVICRPPENKIDDTYIEYCRPNLINTINKLKPRVIVLIGGPAVKSLIELEWGRDIGPIGRWVGWRIPSRKHNAWLCPTYHPSFSIRSGDDPVIDRLIKQHIKAAFDSRAKPFTTPSLETLRGNVRVVENHSKARREMMELNKKRGWLAFDFETTGLKPDAGGHEIVCCSFRCEEEESAVSYIIEPKSYPILSFILLNDNLQKIASNLKFEERWTRKLLGHRVKGWFWDTMLAAHILDNRPDICSLKFQAYVNFGYGDYESAVKSGLRAKTANSFNRIKELNIRDLLVYNALDSEITYRLAKVQVANWLGKGPVKCQS